MNSITIFLTNRERYAIISLMGLLIGVPDS